ncbi:probable N-acetyltransferase 14 [Heterodontus francisci]|uniref:probable N-acetyltransferase 14 n=1 Tax=Heterodontus francisci TaxID=7792 RepID=UPI00355B4E8E
MPLLDISKLVFRQMEEGEREIVSEMLKDGSRETENRLLLYAMTRPAALLLMAVSSSALRFVLSSFAAALLAPVAFLAALLKVGLHWRWRLPPPAGGQLWVAVHDGEDVCGCVAFDPRDGGGRGGDPPSVELLRLAVGRWHRRSGVATFLLAALEAWARAEGRRRVTLRVEAANRAAVALFEKRGYRPSGGGGGLCSGISLEYAKDL